MLVIQNLGAGQCLFKDLYNRVGVLQFDPVFQDLFDIFSTTPTEDADEEPEPEAPEPETLEPKAPEPEIPELPEDKIISKPEPLLDFEFTEDDLFTKGRYLMKKKMFLIAMAIVVPFLLICIVLGGLVGGNTEVVPADEETAMKYQMCALVN